MAEIHVEQFRYGNDNLAYLVHAGGEAMVIDGGAATRILTRVRSCGLSLRLVTNTHGHADHTSGDGALVHATSARHLAPSELCLAPSSLSLGGERIEIIPTPGHSSDSIVFYTGAAAITGDTLFNGTIGNCFTRDLDAFHASIRALMALPDETLVYAGHDYVLDSLAFAAALEPSNEEIAAQRAKHDPSRVVSTLGDERRTNPYLRFNEPTIVALLESRGLPVATERERFLSLMKIG